MRVRHHVVMKRGDMGVSQAVESIALHGLQTKYTHDEAGTATPEGGALWASLELDGFYQNHNYPLIVFQAPKPDIKLGPKELPDADFGVVQRMGSSVVVYRDVPPEDILCIDKTYTLGGSQTDRLSWFRQDRDAQTYYELFIEEHTHSPAARVAARFRKEQRLR